MWVRNNNQSQMLRCQPNQRLKEERVISLGFVYISALPFYYYWHHSKLSFKCKGRYLFYQNSLLLQYQFFLRLSTINNYLEKLFIYSNISKILPFLKENIPPWLSPMLLWSFRLTKWKMAPWSLSFTNWKIMWRLSQMGARVCSSIID